VDCLSFGLSWQNHEVVRTTLNHEEPFSWGFQKPFQASRGPKPRGFPILVLYLVVSPRLVYLYTIKLDRPKNFIISTKIESSGTGSIPPSTSLLWYQEGTGDTQAGLGICPLPPLLPQLLPPPPLLPPPQPLLPPLQPPPPLDAAASRTGFSHRFSSTSGEFTGLPSTHPLLPPPLVSGSLPATGQVLIEQGVTQRDVVYLG
jgi:hypothetical protein